MPGGELTHVVVSQNGLRRLATRASFVKEADLQELVKSSPELLNPLGENLNFVPIGWEVPLGTGRLDLLFVDSNGVLTLIETKLRANDEVRREVLGQILEYAMFASLWTLDDVRASASSFLDSKFAPGDLIGKTLEEAVALRLGWLEESEEQRTANINLLLQQIETNLEKGLLRVVVGVDEKVETLERLVNYLSTHSDLRVVLLQVSSFPVEGGLSVLVPTLHGDIDSSLQHRHSQGRPPNLTVADVLDSYPEGAEREAVSKLVDASREAGATFEAGPNGFSIRARTKLQRQPVSVAWIFVPGRWGWMRTKDISLGHGLDYPATDPQLRSIVARYHDELVQRGLGVDVSSKGVQARSLTGSQAADRIPELLELLLAVINDLSEATPPAG